MEFEGKVSIVPEMAKIQTQRGEMQRQDVIFELPSSGDFAPRKVCVEFWNERATKAASLREGDVVIVNFRVDSREYNGRWYTRVTGMSIDFPRPAAPAFDPYAANAPTGVGAPAYASAPTPQIENTPGDGGDDLPF